MNLQIKEVAIQNMKFCWLIVHGLTHWAITTHMKYYKELF